MDVYCKHIWRDNEQEEKTGFRVFVSKTGQRCARCLATWDGESKPPEVVIGYTNG